MIGQQLTAVAVSYQVYRLTGSNLDVGLISLVQLVPAFLGALLGGAIADHFDRRRVLLCTATALVLGSAALALNATARHPSLLVIYLLAGVISAFASADSPTRTAMLISMVDRSDFVMAGAMRQLFQQVSIVVGPSIGGVLLGGGVSVCFYVNAAMYCTALATVFSVAPRPPTGVARKFSLRTIVDGLTFVREKPAIQGCFIADLNAMILGMPTALFPALGLVRFHGGSATVGLLFAAPGVGALFAALVSGWTKRINKVGHAISAMIIIWGFAIAGFGFTRSLPLALLLLAVAGAADAMSAVFRSLILQLEAPDELRGRLTSLQSAVVTGGPRLGNLEAGGVAAAFGTSFSVISGGFGCAVVMVLIMRALPKFLSYDMRVHRQVAVDG